MELLSGHLEETLTCKIENNTKNDDLLPKFLNSYRFNCEDKLIKITSILSEVFMSQKHLIKTYTKNLKLFKNQKINKKLKKIAIKDKKTLSSINLNSLIESYDCQFLNMDTVKIIKTRLKTLLSFLARKANKKLLCVLYAKDWFHEIAHFILLKISMGFPDEIALKSRRKIEEAKKIGEKWYEKGLNVKNKSFYSLDFAESLISVGKGKEARYSVEAVLKNSSERDPIFVFSVLNQVFL